MCSYTSRLSAEQHAVGSCKSAQNLNSTSVAEPGLDASRLVRMQRRGRQRRLQIWSANPQTCPSTPIPRGLQLGGPSVAEPCASRPALLMTHHLGMTHLLGALHPTGRLRRTARLCRVCGPLCMHILIIMFSSLGSICTSISVIPIISISVDIGLVIHSQTTQQAHAQQAPQCQGISSSCASGAPRPGLCARWPPLCRAGH